MAGANARLLSAQAPSAGEGLHRLAEEHGADLLVVGSCERGRFGRAMLGSDTRAALNGASCAVAIAPVGYAGLRRDLSVIGVGYDASPESEAALAAARVLAAQNDALVLACEVVSLPSYAYSSAFVAGWAGNIESLLARSQERLDALGGVQGHPVYGVTGEELAVFGRDVDLLIVGSRGYGPGRRLIEGSTSGYLVGHARCALLVLPRADLAAADTEHADRVVAAAGRR